MPRPAQLAVAASSRWTGEDGIRYPGGDTHAWVRGTNQTLCGVPLSRAHLARFPMCPGMKRSGWPTPVITGSRCAADAPPPCAPSDPAGSGSTHAHDLETVFCL